MEHPRNAQEARAEAVRWERARALEVQGYTFVLNRSGLITVWKSAYADCYHVNTDAETN